MAMCPSFHYFKFYLRKGLKKGVLGEPNLKITAPPDPLPPGKLALPPPPPPEPVLGTADVPAYVLDCAPPPPTTSWLDPPSPFKPYPPPPPSNACPEP